MPRFQNGSLRETIHMKTYENMFRLQVHANKLIFIRMALNEESFVTGKGR